MCETVPMRATHAAHVLLISVDYLNRAAERNELKPSWICEDMRVLRDHVVRLLRELGGFEDLVARYENIQ